MKARLAKKILKNLSVLHLEPGDVLLVQTSSLVPTAARERVREEVGQFFPGHKVLVVAGWELAAVRPPTASTLKLIGKDGEVLEEIPDGLRPGEWVTPPHLADMVRVPSMDEPPAGGE